MDLPSEQQQTLSALWQTLKRIDKSKINTWMAFRNAAAVAIPLSLGIVFHHALAGVAIAAGALNVSYSDGRDPYAHRARRMLGWTALSAVSVFLGSVTGSNSWLAVVVAALWAFMAGMLVSVSTRMGDLGLNTLVSLIVFAARGAMPLEGAATAAGLVVIGGLIQAGVALLLWPIHGSEPERAAIADAFGKLAVEVDPKSQQRLSSLTPISQQTQEVLDALGMDHSVEGERYRLLFDQVDRIRLSAFVVNRLMREFDHDPDVQQHIESILQATSRILSGVAGCLGSENSSASLGAMLRQVHALLDEAPRAADGLLKELADAVEVLAGQLRVVIRLAVHSGIDGESFAREESTHTWRLQIASWLGSMRANLVPSSAFFRHAIRLSACVTVGDAIGRSFSWQRTYWIPMTIAVVLKPDFTTTISRGVLRLGGTFLGLGLATILYHLLPQSALAELVLVGTFTFMLRSIGPANYGVFTTAVSGLIVFLIAETGIAPSQVVAQRALNTSIGGIFALLAYLVWPTWERTQIRTVIASLIDAAREYFQAVASQFGKDEPLAASHLDRYRAAWRKARSDAEVSLDRLNAEPGTRPAQASCLASILASSNSLVHCVMGLEAEVLKTSSHTALAAFQSFAHEVDLTLYFLSAALRGSGPAMQSFPKLREDHTRMVQARGSSSALDELVILETDRLTVSLNTLREQIVRYLAA